MTTTRERQAHIKAMWDQGEALYRLLRLNHFTVTVDRRGLPIRYAPVGNRHLENPPQATRELIKARSQAAKRHWRLAFKGDNN